jgi:oligopeptide/dipeptide ABC transporter ATP-binding protein
MTMTLTNEIEETDQTDVLALDGLSVSYPKYGQAREVVLRDVTLKIGSGEIVALVGESGSGKSMLARAIMRLVPAPGRIDAGTALFMGQDLGELDGEALRKIRGRDLAMVVSNPRGELDPLETVGTQIGNVLRYHMNLDKGAAKERVLGILDDVRIPDPERRYNAYPHELSGGMAQRVVIAIALACAPKFIISDDATSGLDVTVQAQVLELLKRLIIDRGSSMLFITRDIGIAAHFSDRVAVIYKGEIVEIAPREEFFANPAHPYTILLMAAFSHNARLRGHWIPKQVQVERIVPGIGCAFRDRCVRVEPRCSTETPEFRALGRAHFVRCHSPVER